MPFYEYKCSACGNEFEELIRCDEDLDNLKCTSCGDKNVAKKLSLFGMTTSGGKTVTSTAGGGHSCGGCTKHSCAGCH